MIIVTSYKYDLLTSLKKNHIKVNIYGTSVSSYKEILFCKCKYFFDY